MENKITWLASYPKSGNTWVRLLLNAYIYGNNDYNNMTVVTGDVSSYYYDSLSPIKDLTREQSILLRPATLLHMLAKGADIVKTHNANNQLLGVELIPDILTKRAIYIVRDPRDIVISNANHFGTDIDKTIDKLNDPCLGLDNEPTLSYLNTWQNHVKSWENSTFPTLIIKYEDLWLDTDKELSKILKFIDIEPETERLKTAIELCKFERMRDKENVEPFKEKSKYQETFFNTCGSNWKNVLTKRQSAEIEGNCIEVMLKYEYIKRDSI